MPELKDLTKTKWIVNGASPDQVRDLIRKYVVGLKWSIVSEGTAGSSLTLASRCPETSVVRMFITRQPQIAEFAFSKEGDGTTIEISFQDLPGFEKVLRRVCWSASASLVIELFIDNVFPTAATILWAFVTLPALFLLLYLAMGKKHAAFAEHLYGHVEQQTEHSPRVIYKAAIQPNIRHLVSPQGLVLAIMFVIVLGPASGMGPLWGVMILGLAGFMAIAFFRARNAAYRRLTLVPTELEASRGVREIPTHEKPNQRSQSPLLAWAMDGASLEEVRRPVAEFFETRGWETREKVNGGRFTLEATNPQTSKLSLAGLRKPQIAELSVHKESARLVVELSFRLHTQYRRLLNRISSFSLTMGSFGIVVAVISEDDSLGKLIAGSAILPVAYAYAVFAVRGEYDDLVRDLRSHLHSSMGMNVLSLRSSLVSPINKYLAVQAVAAGILVGAFYVLDPSSFLPHSLSPLEWTTLVLVATMSAELALIALVMGLQPATGERLGNYLPCLIIGTMLGFYAVVPVLASGSLVIGHWVAAMIGGLLYIGLWWLLLAFPGRAIRYSLSRRGQHRYVTSLERFTVGTAILKVLFLFYWLTSSLLSVITFYLAISGLEHLVLGRNHILRSESIQTIAFLYGDIGVAIYSMPILAILVEILRRRWIERSEVLAAGLAPPDVHEIASQVCSHAQIPVPRVIIAETDPASTHVSYVLGVGPVLTLARALLRELSAEQLRSIVAHEVWHLKKHARWFALIDLLSEWSLFGKGFLAIATDSRELEFAADRFAVFHLKSVGLDRDTLVSALNTVSNLSTLSRLTSRPQSVLQISDSHARKNLELTLRDKATILYDIYFGNLILSYVHPTLAERIERIRAIA